MPESKLLQSKCLVESTAFLAILLCSAPAYSQDWGYDSDTGNSVEELKAAPQALSAPPAKSLQHKGKEKEHPKQKAISDKAISKSSAQYAWLQLFGLVAPLAGSDPSDPSALPSGPDYSSSMSAEQKKRFSAFLHKKCSESGDNSYKSIVTYWPELEKAFSVEDHKGNYRLLFRSLLRMRAESTGVPAEERGILLEALGPERIAIKGEPSLSEDAIKAYSDMACFLYEQNHPGKTIDADDNRKLFDLVIRDKFKNAPAFADRLAMSFFPINWAKFRILYTDASEEERQVLVKKLGSAEKNEGATVSNALLEKVLSLPPWKEVVVKANKLTRPVGQKAEVRALKLGETQ